MSKLLIVIPAYNEQDNIVRVVTELTEHYPQYDYVVVNDGSRDRTAALCRAHGFKLIDLPVNLGLAGAFQTGLRYAAENGYDCALQFDGDGQHQPRFIAPMLELLEDGADIVIGSRFITVKKPKSLRMLGSYLISWAIRLTTGRAICDPTSGMRMFNRRLLEEFAQNLNYGPEPDTISYLIKNGAVVPQAGHHHPLPRKEPVRWRNSLFCAACWCWAASLPPPSSCAGCARPRCRSRIPSSGWGFRPFCCC